MLNNRDLTDKLMSKFSFNLRFVTEVRDKTLSEPKFEEVLINCIAQSLIKNIERSAK